MSKSSRVNSAEKAAQAIKFALDQFRSLAQRLMKDHAFKIRLILTEERRKRRKTPKLSSNTMLAILRCTHWKRALVEADVNSQDKVSKKKKLERVIHPRC